MIIDVKPNIVLDVYLTEQHKDKFHRKGEHYALLSAISQQYRCVRIYDIGTYQGMSAVALSINPSNHVISYDIGDYVEVKRPDNVEFRVGNFYNDPELFNSPLILFDIAPHNGQDEKIFYSKLVQFEYKGTVIFDDIHFNDEMNDFWNSITQEKYDLTHLGHWSGTGIVHFK